MEDVGLSQTRVEHGSEWVSESPRDSWRLQLLGAWSGDKVQTVFPEVRERAARMVQEHRGECPSFPPGKVGCTSRSSPTRFARPIVGWRVSDLRTDFVLNTLEHALYARLPERDGALIHHSGRGSQYVSIRYSERLAEAGIEPSVGSRGDSYDNALAETINGLHKTELIHRRGPWKTKAAVELATLEWVSWFNTQRLLGSIGYIPPTDAEANYYRQLVESRVPETG
jgi:hypothetical protein